MSLANAYVGARYSGQTITWKADGVAKDLSGAVITARLKEKDGDLRACDGIFTLVTATSGIFKWAYGATDVGTAGAYKVQFKATVDALYDLSDWMDWDVLAVI